jgi:hypothetical protein
VRLKEMGEAIIKELRYLVDMDEQRYIRPLDIYSIISLPVRSGGLGEKDYFIARRIYVILAKIALEKCLCLLLQQGFPQL